MNEKMNRPRQVMKRPKVCPRCKQPFNKATEGFESVAIKIKAVIHFKDVEGKELKKEISTPLFCNLCIEDIINDEILSHCSIERYAARLSRAIERFESERPGIEGDSE